MRPFYVLLWPKLSLSPSLSLSLSMRHSSSPTPCISYEYMILMVAFIGIVAQQVVCFAKYNVCYILDCYSVPNILYGETYK